MITIKDIEEAMSDNKVPASPELSAAMAQIRGVLKGDAKSELERAQAQRSSLRITNANNGDRAITYEKIGDVLYVRTWFRPADAAPGAEFQSLGLETQDEHRARMQGLLAKNGTANTESTPVDPQVAALVAQANASVENLG